MFHLAALWFRLMNSDCRVDRPHDARQYEKKLPGTFRKACVSRLVGQSTPRR
jgi:hypothetical protein